MKEMIGKAAEDSVEAEYTIALSGAGISTESGVRDFRGPSGVWAKDPDAERRAYESYEQFLKDPREYRDERLRAPSLLCDLTKVAPNPGHYALAEIESMGIMKSLITQNVDVLHERAGSGNVIEYHGSYSKLRCSRCRARSSIKGFDLEKLKEKRNLLPLCGCGGALKYDVVHFREPNPEDVARKSQEEAWRCDLMLICGTSTMVYPFAELPRLAKTRIKKPIKGSPSGEYLAKKVPAATVIEVNGGPTPVTEKGISDYLIQGKTDQILPEIV